jgi:hypothetical protein
MDIAMELRSCGLSVAALYSCVHGVDVRWSLAIMSQDQWLLEFIEGGPSKFKQALGMHSVVLQRNIVQSLSLLSRQPILLFLVILIQYLHSIFRIYVTCATPNRRRRNQISVSKSALVLKCSLNDRNLLHSGHGRSDINSNQRHCSRSPDQGQLQSRIVFTDRRRMHFCRRQRKVPVPHKCLWWRE